MPERGDFNPGCSQAGRCGHRYSIPRLQRLPGYPPGNQGTDPSWAARELGYTPNVSARNLSAKKPPNIGLIVSGLLEGNQKDNLVYLLLQGVLSYATKHRLEIALYTTDSQEQRKRSYTEFCAQHSISGTILSGITTDDAYFSELMDSGIPTVAVDVPIPNENAAGYPSITARRPGRQWSSC